MHYKGERITSQYMRMDKQLVKDMGDVVDDPEFPLVTKRRPITVPGPPKGFNKVRADPAPAATSSSQATAQQAGAEISAQQTTRASSVEDAKTDLSAPAQGQH